jgi:autotransporter-associated beta strand protein
MGLFAGILRVITSGGVIGFLMAVAAAPAGAATRVWDGGGGADNNWMNGANWQNNIAPVAGDSLEFSAGFMMPIATNNNFPNGTKFDSITFSYGSVTVSGNRILIGSAITHYGQLDAVINCNLTLEGGLSATGVTLNVTQPTGYLQLKGAIDSTGGLFQPTLRKIGNGIVEMFGVNTYGNVTAIEVGDIRIHHASALGAATANTVVSDGAVLSVQIAGAPVVAEPLMLAGQGTSNALDGALTFRLPTTWGGTIALFGASTPSIALSYTGAFSSISGKISGDTGLIKQGPSWLRLSGDNTYTGMTYVMGEALVVGHAHALGSPSAGTNVGSGGSVRIDVAGAINEPLLANTEGSGGVAIYCESQVTFTCTWNGPIDLFGLNAFAVSSGHTLRLYGDIGGPGSFEASGAGFVELYGNNTYAGKTVPGNIRVNGGGHRIPDASYVQFKGNGTLDLSGNAETIGSITGAATNQITLAAGTLTIDTPDPWSSFQGVITGSGGLIKKGVGTLAIQSAQAYTGMTTVQAGVLRVEAQGVLPGPVKVTGGILRGTGSVGALQANGGRIEPGLSAGVLKALSLNLSAGATLAFELNGPAVGTQYDQLQVTGGINVNGATLELSAPNDAAFNSAFIIVKNDGQFAVTGTFAGLAEGAIVFPSNGRALRISYVGGDGNDIVLTPAAPAYYLSEGATGAFFDTDILIANPSATAAEAALTFLLSDGTTKAETRNVPGRSRLTISVDEIAGLDSTAVSTIVTSTSGLALVVERTMRWDASGYGAHTEKAVGSTAKDWYFAEGSQGFFSTYLLLANPQPSPNVATVRYLREQAPAIVRTYQIDANSRFTVDASTDPELVGYSFGMHVAFDQPGVAERSMYFGADPFWKAGHESAGVTEPSAMWFLAEGATGPFFETFVLLANPGDQPAEATVTFLPDNGAPVVKTVPIPAQERITLNIETEDASLANAAVATQVTSTRPILVERAQYWPDPAPQWYEAHNSFGVTAAGTKWGLAEGRSGGPREYQTYILLANPGTVKANVTITYLREGQTPVEKTYEVNPQSRLNADTGLVSELAGLNFGAVITSDQPIAVERAMYSNANGQLWAAGTNATATPLP